LPHGDQLPDHDIERLRCVQVALVAMRLSTISAGALRSTTASKRIPVTRIFRTPRD